MVPPYSDRIPRVPPYSSSCSAAILGYGAVTLYRAPFQTLPLTHTLIQALGCSPFARRYWGISVDFFSSGYLDVSVPRFASLTLWIQLMIVCQKQTGFPPFESPVITVYMYLTDAYRRSARPSSPLTVRASTVTLSRLTSQPEDVSTIHHRVAKIRETH